MAPIPIFQVVDRWVVVRGGEIADVFEMGG
jgi:hypothetical protein